MNTHALKDFRDFILRGNVIDLAIGIVIGIAFGGVVTAFVKDLLMPLIGIPGKLSFASAAFSINGSVFSYGDFITVAINFIILAAVIFFLVVRPMNALLARAKHEPPADPTDRQCPYCLSTVPLKATRCAYCTSQLEPVAAPEPVPVTPGGAAGGAPIDEGAAPA